MNYEDMSDFEINKKVAGVFLPCDYLFDEKNKRVELANYQDVMIGDMYDQILAPYQEFNPCNNPSDAWPIITSNDINLSKHKADDYWFAFTRAEDLGVSEFKCKDSNPLRAACVCFLKMKDTEK